MNLSSLIAAAATILGISTGATSSPPVAPAHCVTITRPLAVGSSGSDVSALQTFLGVKATGYFGPMTQKALTQWQIENHVVTSSRSAGAGQAGPKTRTALKCAQTVEEQSVTKIPVQINPPVAAPSTTTIPAAPSLPKLNPVPSVGGGGGITPSASQCKPFTTPKPSAADCTTGEWILVEDEAGCPAEWDCEDPNATQ